MSQENVEVMRAVVDAFNRGDLDAALQHFDPYAVIRLDRSWPERRPRLGGDEVRLFFEDLVATTGMGETVVEDVIDASDRVVQRNRARFRGQGSGVEDDVVFTQVATFRRGKVVMLEYFFDHQEALDAAGLRE